MDASNTVTLRIRECVPLDSNRSPWLYIPQHVQFSNRQALCFFDLLEYRVACRVFDLLIRTYQSLRIRRTTTWLECRSPAHLYPSYVGSALVRNDGLNALGILVHLATPCQWTQDYFRIKGELRSLY